MKNNILIALLVIICVCPLKGQNHDIHIYLNNGDIHSFFYNRADSITFNTSNEQCIWTTDSIYSVNISEIDSISFGGRKLPVSFYEENFAGWSDVLFCNNGMVAFHAEKTENEPEKSLIFLPDDKNGIICSYAKYNKNSYPYLITFNDDVIYITEDEYGNDIYTITQGDSLVCRFGSSGSDNYHNEVRGIIRRSFSENNWPRNIIAVCKVLTGLTQSVGSGFVILASLGTGGPSNPISAYGLLVGGSGFGGGKDMVQSGLITLWIPAAQSSKGLDNYGKEFTMNISEELIVEGLKKGPATPYLLRILPEDAMYYLANAPKESKWTSWTFFGKLSLDFLDAKFGETITKADKMIAIYDKGKVITGIVKDIMPYSATVRGYVSPELTYGLNGENIDVEYGIIVKGNGNNYTKKITNEHGGLIEFNLEGLSPSCEYTYFSYVWDRTDAILRYGETKNFTTPALPIANTGDSSDITITSATVSCSYENVPEDGVCGVEYTWSDGTISKSIGRINGTQSISLSGLRPGTTYTYCAFIEAYGQTYYGENKILNTESLNCSVILSDFKVTKSRYKEDGFENDGVKYDYRFDASVTATLDVEDISYIREWGYVYEDPNGKKAEIPLSEFGTNYTDSRYAYFRNSAHSTARLYGYAYIIGSENPIYGEVHDYPLDHNMAVATTGECSNVTTNSATVSCTYENVPEGATCGVEYTWNEGTHKQSASSSNGTQTITLSGLKSGTTYTYRAYIDDDGQLYYGVEKTFTTQVELPDLSGTWSCTIYNVDNTVLDTPTLTFTSDKKVTQTGSSFTSEDKVGSWSVDTDGSVGINFSWTGGSWSHPVYYGESFSGVVNSISNPSSIEGTVYRAWAGISEHGNTYRFVMSR